MKRLQVRRGPTQHKATENRRNKNLQEEEEEKRRAMNLFYGVINSHIALSQKKRFEEIRSQTSALLG